jgi:hypothetical protein
VKALARQGSIRGKHKEREYDLRETPPEATRALIRTGALDRFNPILEPCAGKGAICRELIGWGAWAFDLVAYEGADDYIITPVDFLQSTETHGCEAIVTNPPYRWADDFIRHGLKLGLPVYVLLRLMSLEGAGRSDIMAHLHHVYIGIERLPMMHRPGWRGKKQKQGAMPFGWFVFLPEKNHHGFFSASRISWREEDKNGLNVDSSSPGDGSAGEEEPTIIRLWC